MKFRFLGRMIFAGATVAAFSMSLYANMTDQQVVEYVKQQKASGASNREIGAALLSNGVSQEQIERIKNTYTGEGTQEEAIIVTETGDINRMRVPIATSTGLGDAPMVGASNLLEPIKLSGRKVFGKEIFTTQALTFEPNQNLATPSDYQLGPGDEVIIDIWGASEDRLRSVISPEGNIVIEQLGPVYLNGMTIDEANNHLRRLFAYKYAGVEEQETDLSLTLGQVRTIQVNVLGEVNTPGTYRLSPFSNVFNAIYHSGGVNDIGSLRNVEIRRNGKKIATVDLYDLIMKGKDASHLYLREGDVIIVPPYETLVSLAGSVKRPMYYELKKGENISDLFNYAGGFTNDAYTDLVTVTRPNGKEHEMYNVVSGEFRTYELLDGDRVTVGQVLDRFTNRVTVSGKVLRPGTFALDSDIKTLTELVKAAEGLEEDAYTDRVLIFREGPDLRTQVLSVNLASIMDGTAPDVVLQKNDVIQISGLREIFQTGDVSIGGYVHNPGTFSYVRHMTVNDLILRAGGLAEGASEVRIEVARRILDPESLEPLNETAQTFTLAYNDEPTGSGSFIIEPYDIVTVRKSPTYVPQQRVAIGGEVVFEGAYTLVRRNERLSDLVRRAGGLTDAAYVKGASLTRQMTEDEMRARDETIRLAHSMQGGQGNDSVSVPKLILSNRYSIGIRLDLALANPGGTQDIVLQENDVLFIPQEVSTVKIQGEVMYPITVAYKEGAKLKYYIDQAGGYGNRAKKSRGYVVYMNGTAARAKSNTPIEPGCQIIIPSKGQSHVNWNAIMSVATAGGTVATMAAAVANLLKK